MTRLIENGRSAALDAGGPVRPYWTVSGLAQTLGMSRSAVRDMAYAGLVEAVRVGVGRGAFRITDASVRDFLCRRRVGGGVPRTGVDGDAGLEGAAGPRP